MVAGRIRGQAPLRLRAFEMLQMRVGGAGVFRQPAPPVFWGSCSWIRSPARNPGRVTESGRHGQAIDRSYRFAERISPLTRAADQPRGLRGVFRLATWNVYLEVGFSLRCFQRLSLPHLATQLWTERSNWHTRGASFPILSY